VRCNTARWPGIPRVRRFAQAQGDQGGPPTARRSASELRRHCVSQRRRRSCLAWQGTQRAASGLASSRPSGTDPPQSAHTPYVPCSIRPRATMT